MKAQIGSTTLMLHLAQMATQMQQVMYDSGVCCFSEINDNILLWAHYADNHRGVCLKFSTSINNVSTMMAKVNYSLGYEKVNFWTKEGESIYHLIFTKSHDWEYEKEIRAFRMLDNGKTEFDINCLTEIIFGCKTGQQTITKLKKLVSDLNYNHVKFRQAIQTKSSFQLQIEPKVKQSN